MIGGYMCIQWRQDAGGAYQSHQAVCHELQRPAILKEFGHEQQCYNDDSRRGEESQILATHDLASHRLGQRRHQMVGKQRCRAR